MSKRQKVTDAKCIFCGGELSWDGSEEAYRKSFNYGNDGEAMVYYLRCRKCGRDYEIIDPEKNDREGQYKEYWNQ